MSITRLEKALECFFKVSFTSISFSIIIGILVTSTIGNTLPFAYAQTAMLPINTIPLCIDFAGHIFPLSGIGIQQQQTCPFSLTPARITIVQQPQPQQANLEIVCLFLSFQQQLPLGQLPSSLQQLQVIPFQGALSTQLPLGCIPSMFLSSVIGSSSTAPLVSQSQFLPVLNQQLTNPFTTQSSPSFPLTLGTQASVQQQQQSTMPSPIFPPASSSLSLTQANQCTDQENVHCQNKNEQTEGNNNRINIIGTQDR